MKTKNYWFLFAGSEYFLAAFLGFGFYNIFLWTSFYLNEILFMAIKFTPLTNIIILVLLLIVANLFPWEKISKNKLLISFMVVFILMSNVFLPMYFKELRQREYLPKIYQLSKNSFFQSEELKIEGKNFGQTFQKGRVVAEEIEFTVKEWSSSLIVVEIPVPSHFGRFNLKVICSDGKESNPIKVIFRDPKELEKIF